MNIDKTNKEVGVSGRRGRVQFHHRISGYFDALGIPVTRGRTFDARDRVGAEGVVIVNEAFAEFYFPGILWPDFDRHALVDAVVDYQSRERRFGGAEDSPGLTKAAD